MVSWREKSSRFTSPVLSYRGRLFLLLMFVAWTIVACFVVFQYRRERQFKAEYLNERLQTINAFLANRLSQGTSPAQSASMTTSMPDGDKLRVTVISPSGRVIYDNRLDTLPLSDHKGRPEVSQAIKTGEGYAIDRHSATNDVEYFYSALLMPDGRVVRTAVPYDHDLRSMLEADRTFLWFMVLVTLLTSITGAALARAMARKEERECMTMKRQLTNNINHELKTPVASIQLCLETIREHPGLPNEKAREFVDRAWANAERLRRLLVDVAAITRMDDGGRQVYDFEQLDLSAVITEAANDERMKAEESGMTIIIHTPGKVTMKGNSGLLNSIFRNLLTNAVTYSSGTQTHIAVTSVQPKVVVVEVWDNGVGVGPEHLPHLMDRFYRVDTGRSRRGGGTGLGLAIVKNAVQLHGGSIRVFNRQGGGLKFVFSLSRV